MPIDVTAALLESLVGDEEGLKVTAALLETLVAPDLDTTKVHAALLEVLVNPGRQYIHGVLLEVLVALPPSGTLVDTLDLDVEIHSVPVKSYKPLTGVHASEVAIGGWKWDRRRTEDDRTDYTQYLSRLGGHVVGLLDGTTKAQWQSGTTGGCAYHDIAHKYVDDYATWTPRVETGSYALAYDDRNLYSDCSYTSSFDSTDLDPDSFMVKTLRDDCVYDTIQVAMWRRDSTFSIYKHWDFRYVEEFTMDIVDGERPEVESPTESDISPNKYEFIIREGEVILNGNHYISNYFETSPGYPVLPAEDPGSLVEPGGANRESGRDIYLKYLPVQLDSVRVYLDTGAATLTEMTYVDDLRFADPTELCFAVDHDLGIVSTSGYQADNLILQEDINSSAEEIHVYTDSSVFDQYPGRGVVTIGTEEVAYYEKTARGFGQCVRGYNSTVAASHTAGDEIEHRRQGLGQLGDLYVEYIAVPRIDYEVSECNLRSANRAPWLDVRPMSVTESTNILQIYPGDVSLDSIVLETDTPLLGGNLYGPVYYGSDVSRLTARALDPRSNPVQDVDLTISIVSGSGYLNGSLADYVDNTNTSGEIYAFYNHPMVRSELEYAVSSVTHVSGDTEMVVAGLEGDVSPDDVWIFQVLKHDKLVGTTGLGLAVTAEGAASLPYGLYYLDLDGVVGDEYRGGFIAITISGTKYYRNITWLEKLVDGGTNVTYTRIYLDSALVGAVGDTAYLLESQAVEWNSSLLNGSRYILYEFRGDVEHPLTGDLGAYYPLHPDSVSGGGVLTFESRELPVPDADDVTNNLGAYVVVAPGKVSLQAFGLDPVSGRTIESNVLRLVLELPPFMVGVDTTGVLPIPTGWRFPTEEHNIGGGLGGANFITLNPVASGINQFALNVEI